MIEQTKWTSRTFSFESPAGLYPVFLERLRGAPLRAELLVAECPPDLLAKRIDNHWSVQEHIGHLLELDLLHETRFDEFIAGVKTLTAADMTNHATEMASFNNHPIATILDKFKSERLRFVHRLSEIDDDLIIRSSLHPRLQKPMRLIDMVFFTAEHDDHHLALARSIIDKL